jgi:ABC-type antimicrobial peptide transport system permease subunit
VGVVGDVRLRSLETPARATLYWSQLQVPNSFMTVVVRTPRSSGDVAAVLRGAIAALDPKVPVSRVESLDELLAASLTSRRTLLVLIASFAGLALCLAAVGLYGVLSYAVAQRSGELGVRMALGADGRKVARLVVGDGLKLVALGVGVGLAGAAAVGRVLTGLLFGVEPWDPAAFAAVVAVTLIVTAVALCVPAWRAARTDPVVALRYE